MKKIDLVTLYNVENYGALLQAYALQEAIKMNNCECEIVQHNRFGFEMGKGKKTRRDKINDILQYLRLSLKNPFVLKYFFARYNNKIKTELLENQKETAMFRKDLFPNLTHVFYESYEHIKVDPPICDGYICGSDQIWNPSRFEGAAPFFLDFGDDSVSRIAYAPSLAVDSIPENMRESYKTWVSRFDALSVREKSGCDAIYNATGYRPEWVLDPTFLMSKNQWEQLAIEDKAQKKPFIFCYFIGKENFISAYPSIKKLAKRLNADIVVLPKGRHILAENLTTPNQLCGPRAFLGYIKNAEYIITDSFHGTALSLNFEKQFCAFKGRKNSSFVYKFSRIQNILDITGLSDQYFYEGETPNTALIDYEIVRNRLSEHIDNSKKYLEKAIASVRYVKDE